MTGKEELRVLLKESCLPEAPGPSGAAALEAPGIPAAVLVGLLAHPDGPRVVLTERNPDLRVHAAQISFPGGCIEEIDDGPAAAALREAFEEIGLPAGKVELLGCLPPHVTVTGFLVHPFVGWIEPPVEFVPDPREVAQIIEVPLDFAVDAANHRHETLEVDGVVHHFYALYYEGHRIWGATAGILVSLARLLDQEG